MTAFSSKSEMSEAWICIKLSKPKEAFRPRTLLAYNMRFRTGASSGQLKNSQCNWILTTLKLQYAKCIFTFEQIWLFGPMTLIRFPVFELWILRQRNRICILYFPNPKLFWVPEDWSLLLRDWNVKRVKHLIVHVSQYTI